MGARDVSKYSCSGRDGWVGWGACGRKPLPGPTARLHTQTRRTTDGGVGWSALYMHACRHTFKHSYLVVKSYHISPPPTSQRMENLPSDSWFQADEYRSDLVMQIRDHAAVSFLFRFLFGGGGYIGEGTISRGRVSSFTSTRMTATMMRSYNIEALTIISQT